MSSAEIIDIVAPESQARPDDTRKQAIWDNAEHVATAVEQWHHKNAYFHEEDERYLRFLIRPGLRVLDLGCGDGRLLAKLEPSVGVGVDFSPHMIEAAQRAHPHLAFHVGDVENRSLPGLVGEQPFDVILISDTIGSFSDIHRTFEQLHRLCTADTRIVVSYYSELWEPIIRLAELAGLKQPTPAQNWLSPNDIASILALADFQEIKQERRQLLPKRLFGLGSLINRLLGTLPLVSRLCVRNYLVLRSQRKVNVAKRSLSVVIPCRNERGNIEAAVKRLPVMAPWQEIIFIDGHSSDGTLDEINRVIAAYPHINIKAAVQDGKGKGDAVRKGFAMAAGDILLILDADLTVSPEDVPKFYDIFVSGKGEFVNGSRLVYPMENEAMRFLNLMANRVFSWLFSYLLNQRITDTLCGTKALSREHYQDLAQQRPYFGDFDPFGDFDLIFGATKLNLRLVEVPIRYKARTYGTTQISRFKHGLLLLRMVVFAWWKLKVT